MNFLDICPEGELFLVKMTVETNGDVKEIAFRCREVRPHYYRYKGMSYRNLYSTEDYQKAIDRQRYVLDKQYFVEKEEVVLPDGYSIKTMLHQDIANRVSLQKCILKKSGKKSTNTCAHIIMEQDLKTLFFTVMEEGISPFMWTCTESATLTLIRLKPAIMFQRDIPMIFSILVANPS